MLLQADIVWDVQYIKKSRRNVSERLWEKRDGSTSCDGIGAIKVVWTVAALRRLVVPPGDPGRLSKQR
jgi:hypothetical protein